MRNQINDSINPTLAYVKNTVKNSPCASRTRLNIQNIKNSKKKLVSLKTNSF